MSCDSSTVVSIYRQYTLLPYHRHSFPLPQDCRRDTSRHLPHAFSQPLITPQTLQHIQTSERRKLHICRSLTRHPCSLALVHPEPLSRSTWRRRLYRLRAQCVRAFVPVSSRFFAPETLLRGIAECLGPYLLVVIVSHPTTSLPRTCCLTIYLSLGPLHHRCHMLPPASPL